MILLLLCGLLLAPAVAGSLYLMLSVVVAWRFRRQRPAAGQRPGLSVLKPLHGTWPALAGDLKAVMGQSYPDFEVVFGVHDPADPAAAVARGVIAGHPEVRAQLVADRRRSGSNPKIANLLNMAPAASKEVLVVADADIAVRPGYLDRVGACFIDHRVGAATCLYVGIPESGRPSDRLGAQFINHNFLPSALVAAVLGKLDGCFGATMAARRSALDEIGGFEALKDQLADDFYLGQRIKQAGFRLVLAPVLVGHRVAEADLKTLFHHELRWSRTIRLIEPVGHALSIITLPTVPALLGGLIALSLPPMAMLAGLGVMSWVLFSRWLQVRALNRLFRLPRTPFSDIIFRDCLSFAVHLAAFGSRRVRWNDAELMVDSLGRIETKEGGISAP